MVFCVTFRPFSLPNWFCDEPKNSVRIQIEDQDNDNLITCTHFDGARTHQKMANIVRGQRTTQNK